MALPMQTGHVSQTTTKQILSENSGTTNQYRTMHHGRLMRKTPSKTCRDDLRKVAREAVPLDSA
jgi:hypothetical protein